MVYKKLGAGGAGMLRDGCRITFMCRLGGGHVYEFQG